MRCSACVAAAGLFWDLQRTGENMYNRFLELCMLPEQAALHQVFDLRIAWFVLMSL